MFESKEIKTLLLNAPFLFYSTFIVAIVIYLMNSSIYILNNKYYYYNYY